MSRCHLKITNADIVDGTGDDIYKADVAVESGRIIDIGDLEHYQADQIINADGLPGHEMPHPRLWGTFPRVLKRYVRELSLLSLQVAVHKMTGLSAKTFGLKGRGLIKPDFHADLVIFDPEIIEDVADFDHPEQASKGIHSVFVNGQSVWQKNSPTGYRPGQFLTH